MASAGPVRRRCPPGYLHAHPLSLGSPGAYHACTGLSNDARLAREQPSGDLHAAQITLSPPPPPISASLCSQCPVDVMSRRVSIVSWVPGFRGPRVKGFLEKNGLKGTRGPRASGFRGKVCNLGGRGLKGLICQSSFNIYKGARTSGAETVVLLCCHEHVLEKMSVVLHGRSHPAPRLYEGDLLSGL